MEVQDFHDALKQFRDIQHELLADRKMFGQRTYGNIKKFKNLADFNQYWQNIIISRACRKNKYLYPSYYIKKTDILYQKRRFSDKISVSLKDDPKEYHRQYGWFRNHPEAEAYDPQPRYRDRNQHRNKTTYKMITSKISVSRQENPSEWKIQYDWFRINSSADVYQPVRKSATSKSIISSKISVSRKQNLKEWNRQYHWFRRHPEATVYVPVSNQYGKPKN